MAEKFEAVDWHERDGVPVLDDTVASIVCTLENDVAGGDHRVVVGRVVDGELHPEREPLLYFRGEFCLRAAGGGGR
jgi:3-hydroxy-9,10-secoandrosta-1,3,5(10)-triene-9,17-dione monooxygenase reductase component